MADLAEPKYITRRSLRTSDAGGAGAPGRFSKGLALGYNTHKIEQMTWGEKPPKLHIAVTDLP